DCRREGQSGIVCRTGWSETHSSESVANGARRIYEFRTRCVTSHVATLLCHAHGRERRRLANRADNPWTLGHLDHAGLYASGVRPAENRLQEAPPEGKAEGLKMTIVSGVGAGSFRRTAYLVA